MFSDLDLFANRNPCMSIPANPALPSRCAVDACLSPISKKKHNVICWWKSSESFHFRLFKILSNQKTSEFSPMSSLFRALKLLIQRHCGCGCCWPQLMGDVHSQSPRPHDCNSWGSLTSPRGKPGISSHQFSPKFTLDFSEVLYKNVRCSMTLS